MNQQTVIRAAIAAAFALGTPGAGVAQTKDPVGMEKCFGIAKAGKNDCGSSGTAHSCAGQSKMDNDPKDFKYVKTGTCARMGGKMQPS